MESFSYALSAAVLAYPPRYDDISKIRCRRVEVLKLKFQLLFTAVNFPNAVLPFLAGLAGDCIGDPLCLLWFCSICLVEQFLVATGVTQAVGKVHVLFGMGVVSASVSNENLPVSCLDISEIGRALSNFVASSILGYRSIFLM